MINKKIGIPLISIILFVGLIYIASAITGSIGNSRMVLRLAPGETIDRYILVKNVNDVPVTINMVATGDLSKDLKIKDASFVLQPAQEKQAHFTIKAPQSGTSETKINIQFTPEDGNSIGLTSTIIVVVNESASPGQNNVPDYGTDNGSGVNVNDGSNKSISSGVSPVLLLAISTLVLVIILAALYIYSVKKKRSVRRKK